MFEQYHEVKSSGTGTQEEDVMSTFDPYGTNVYKGMRVADDDGSQNQNIETMCKKGEKVGFKKRKKTGTGDIGTDARANTSSSGSSSSGGNSHENRNSDSGASRNSSYHSNSDIKIKIEKNSSTLPPSHLPFLPPPTTRIEEQKPSIDSYIKTEIKLEPKIEANIPAVKMAFGFNNLKKTRKI